MKSARLRGVAKWTAIVVAALIVAVMAASKIVHSVWNHERAAATITRWSSKKIAGSGPSGQGFTFGRVDYPWLPAVRSLFWGPPVSFDAWEITIWDPAGKEILYAPHVRAGFRLDRLVWRLLRGYLPGQRGDVELHFVEAAVDSVRCHIRLGRDDKVNLVAAFGARVPAPPTKDGLIVEVEGSTIGDGNYRMDFPFWMGEMNHFEMRMDRLHYSSFESDRTPQGPAFTYHVSRIVAPRGAMRIDGYDFPLDHIVVREFAATEHARQDLVMKGVARSLGSDVTADGRLTDTYSGHAGVDMQINSSHGRRVLEQFPFKSYVKGDVSATAHLVGPFSRVVMEGTAKGADLYFPPLEAHHAAARWRLGGGALRLQNITSDVSGGHVTGEVTLDFLAHRWRADLYLEGLKDLPLKFLPLEIQAYLLGRLQRMIRWHRTADETQHLTHGGIDITLFRRPDDNLPHRVLLAGHLAPPPPSRIHDPAPRSGLTGGGAVR